MGESQAHMNLVRVASEYIYSVATKEELGRIYTDTPERGITPAVRDGFHPDALLRSDRRIIIGEAKTEPDAFRPHSISQIKSYYQECKDFCGTSELVIAVPWTILRKVQNAMRLLKQQDPSDVKISVLDECGSVFRV